LFVTVAVEKAFDLPNDCSLGRAADCADNADEYMQSAETAARALNPYRPYPICTESNTIG
jgi:hypothetical protein